MSEEFEASEPLGTRTVSSHSPISSDSTTPLSPDHPLTHVSPTPTPTRVSFHHRTVRMAMRTQPTLSPGMSACIEEAAALSPSSFCKRYRSSYETSSSSLTLPVRKRYRGTFKLILDTDSEGDELRDEDTEEDESLDADDERKRSNDEGHGLGDEDHGLDDESQGLEDEGLGLKEEAIPEGQQLVVPVVETATSEPLGLGYEALRRRELAVEEDQGAERVSAFRHPTLDTWVDLKDGKVYTDIPAYVPLAAPIQTLPSPKWSLGSLPVSPSSPIIPSPIASPVATPTTTISVDEDQFIEVWAQFEHQKSILYDHTQRLDTLPPTLVADIDRDVRERYTRSGARLVLALEAWAGHVDTRLADMSRARYDDHRLIHDMLVQQAAMQRELQEMRGHVTALEQERSRRGHDMVRNSPRIGFAVPMWSLKNIQMTCQTVALEEHGVRVTPENVMSTPAYVNSETIIQADKAQSSRLPVPLPDDPYVAVRQAYEEFEASERSGTRIVSSHSPVSSDSTAPLLPDHPLTHVSPTTTPTRVLFHRRTARMAVCTQPTLSPGMSACIAEATALSPSSFRKRYRSSYETSSSSSSPTLLVQKRYRGTSKLILDTDREGGEFKDEDIEEDESLDADDERERSDDKGHGLGDEDHGLDDESQGLEDKGLGLEEEEEAIPEGQQQAISVGETATSEPLRLGYGALRRHELAVEEDQPTLDTWVDIEDGRVYTDIPAYVPLAAPLELHGSILYDHTKRLDALPPTLVADIDRDVRELYTRPGAAGHVDTRLADMSRARYDDHRLIHDMLVQQAAMQRELQEMGGRVTALEQERSRRGQ
ncbi:hypothetical protein Tco_0129564 [Tanacetum coccineum]